MDRVEGVKGVVVEEDGPASDNWDSDSKVDSWKAISELRRMTVDGSSRERREASRCRMRSSRWWTYPNLKVGGRSLKYSQRQSTITENDRYLPFAQHGSRKRPAHASSYICREHPDLCTPNTSCLYQSANPHEPHITQHTIFLTEALHHQSPLNFLR